MMIGVVKFKSRLSDPAVLAPYHRRAPQYRKMLGLVKNTTSKTGRQASTELSISGTR